MKPEHSALFKLGIAERIQLVEDLWDSIARDAATTGIPELVKEELHRRKAAFESAPESGRTWEQVKHTAR